WQVATDQRFVVRNAQPQTELTIEVRNEPGEARTYTVVYLPAHFPKLVVTVDETTASRDPLYVNLTQLGTAYFIAKLDNAGVPLFYREVDNRAFDFKQHPSGDLSYSLFLQDPVAGSVVVVLDRTF